MLKAGDGSRRSGPRQVGMIHNVIQFVYHIQGSACHPVLQCQLFKTTFEVDLGSEVQGVLTL